MARELGLDDIDTVLSSSEPLGDRAFPVLSSLLALLNEDAPRLEEPLRQATIRLLERRDELNGNTPLLMAAVRHLGLYPYLDTAYLNTADLIAYEAHRPEGEEVEEYVFHERQLAVYQHLIDGENVIVSAPTSFGKSLVIDAIAASRRHNNIVLLVPTLALIDETRRRLSKFSGTYKVVTHSSQSLAERNLFVLTQERFLEFAEFPQIDFFVIDEFYKLNPASDGDRSYLLNQALYELLKTGARFYFLGPNIENIPGDLQVDARFLNETFQTVALDLRPVAKSLGDDGRQSLVDLCQTITEPTLIFCSSPARAKRVTSWLVEDGVSATDGVPLEAVDWIERAYTPEWSLVKAMRSGIGLHHGQVPRALAQYVVRAFNEQRLRFLVCTSTLIEGVNTTAKNVIIFDDRINRSRYDFFTFNNIRGRSGRMFQHFVGHVYVFNPQPQDQLPFVDVPALTQPVSTPTSLLINMAAEDLTPESQERLESVLAEGILPKDVLKSVSGVAPEDMVALAKALAADLNSASRQLSWTGYPSAAQHRFACQLMWDYLGGSKRRIAPSVLSAVQLDFQIRRLRRLGLPAVLKAEIARAEDVDSAVDGVLNFLRQWASFNYPRLIAALDAVQRAVFRRAGLPAGDFRFFAAQVENWFMPFPLVMLEEFGIPVQVGVLLAPLLLEDGASTDIDLVLQRLASFTPRNLKLHPFEISLIEWAQEGL